MPLRPLHDAHRIVACRSGEPPRYTDPVSNLYADLMSSDHHDRVCIEVDGIGMGYREIDTRARSIAAHLQTIASRGDRVIAQTAKSLDSYCLWLGCLAAGLIYVPTNTAYTNDEIAWFCDNAGASLLIRDSVQPDEATSTPSRAQSAHLNALPLHELMAAATGTAPLPEPVDVTDDDPAALVYTSGTTGQPKGAALTHGCLRNNARALAEVWQMRADDVLVHALPIFHVHGLFIALHPLLLVGATVRFLPRFEVDAVLDALDGATVFMGVPTYYHRLLATDRFDAAATEGMRLFTSGSAPMTALTHAAFSERTGRTIVERYGMSEAGIITSNRIGSEVAGSVGHPLPGYQIRIVDTTGSPCPPSVTGAVEVRGPSLCSGYWNRPDADESSRDSDGWFHTGDVGSLDSSGRLTLEGREGDMIISGGLNIYPKEIEVALDNIDGVVESAVIGVPDLEFGERVVACVVLESGITLDTLDLAGSLAPLARFKHPREFRILTELPRNAMAKVQKSRLRADSVAL